MFEAFYTGRRIYLVLEYADNGDLLEFINARKSHAPGIGEAKAKLFFKQLVQGLDYCHNQNIVHRFVIDDILNVTVYLHLTPVFPQDSIDQIRV